jgi:hypothetical protein
MLPILSASEILSKATCNLFTLFNWFPTIYRDMSAINTKREFQFRFSVARLWSMRQSDMNLVTLKKSHISFLKDFENRRVIRKPSWEFK